MKLLVTCGAIGLLLVGCKRAATSQTAGNSPAAAESSLPSSLWLANAPANAKPMAEVKKSAAVGQDVIVSGRIGGRKDPFVTGRAMFLLADRSLPSCTEKHGDGCPTPWDYCCETPETILANTGVVQIVGADGKPLKLGLEGLHGLQPLREVVIVGEVSNAGENVVINATGIYLKE